MKPLLFALALFALAPATHAQTVNTIPNAGFENWTNMGNYDEPVGWNTMNEMFAPTDTVPVRRTSNAHSGNAALRVRTLQAGSFLINGQVTAYAPVNVKPYALTGFFKYLPAGNDTCQLVILMTKYNPGTGEQLIAGAGVFQSGGATEYTPFSAVINYDPALFTNVFPDSMRIYLVPGGNNSPHAPGSELFVDDLALQLAPTAVAEQALQRLRFYPNPAQNQIRIWLPAQPQPGPATLTFTDAAGRTVIEEQIPAGIIGESLLVPINDLKPGIYLVALMQPNRRYTGQLIVLP